MKLVIYSHNSGDRVIPQEIQEPLLSRLRGADFHTPPGGASELRLSLLAILRSLGWTGRVRVAAQANISITAVNGSVGLALQLGNMARFYADLIKLQYFGELGRIVGGVYLIPTQRAATIMGQNMANYERLSRELRYYRNIISLPLLVVGLEEGVDECPI